MKPYFIDIISIPGEFDKVEIGSKVKVHHALGSEDIIKGLCGKFH